MIQRLKNRWMLTKQEGDRLRVQGWRMSDALGKCITCGVLTSWRGPQGGHAHPWMCENPRAWKFSGEPSSMVTSGET